MAQDGTKIIFCIMTPQQKQILTTVAYFHSVECAPTLPEIQRFLFNLNRHKNFSERQETSALLVPLIDGILGEYKGYYFLLGHQNLAEARFNKIKFSVAHALRLRKYIKIFSALPFVRGIALSGSVALANARQDSDWDIMVFADPGRLNFVVLEISIFTALFFRKWQKFGFNNIICLNHFVASDNIPMPHRSLYEAMEFFKLVSLYEEKNALRNFWGANKWIGDYFDAFFSKSQIFTSGMFQIKLSGFLSTVKRLLERALNGRVGYFFERKCKALIRYRVKNRAPKNPGWGRVVVDDHQVEYHPASPQKEILEKYNHIVSEIGLEDLAIERPSDFEWITSNS